MKYQPRRRERQAVTLMELESRFKAYINRLAMSIYVILKKVIVALKPSKSDLDLD